MKSTKIALLIVFIIIAGVAFSQTNTTYKLLTYSRSITGGAQQVDENGKAIDNIRYQYDVFLETSGKTKPIITAFWIKGQPYQKIRKTMLDPWKIGKVIRIENETATTRRIWIEIAETNNFQFKAGQFVTLDLPIHEQKNKRWRSYSIASAPDNSNVIELIIVLLEGGAGTTYIFNEISVGSEITLRGPLGKFVLPEEIDTDIFLICTGTGIAPFRKFSDALYEKELEEIQSKYSGIYYHPVFSREHEVPTGKYKGYVHTVYEQFTQENKQPARFYLCGWKNMIDEAKERILALGYDKKAIHLEIYG
ncbi:unnamed protein product [Rotaria magnacalcarata]|uniref:FAD-binding FR-type domain-containing protein n=1 Tax=Rotaria magnacalcarata TaxID=392030 RepID=A0A819G3F4_9BILA|nr:unnamed protein product [Rotaria magnacalcarata]